MEYPEPEEGLQWVMVDLDGTLAEGVWPNDHIGAPLPHAEEMLEHYYYDYRIAIYTARGWNDLHKIEAWLKETRLGDWVDAVICGKPVAGLYIDDRSWNPNG